MIDFNLVSNFFSNNFPGLDIIMISVTFHILRTYLNLNEALIKCVALLWFSLKVLLILLQWLNRNQELSLVDIGFYFMCLWRGWPNLNVVSNKKVSIQWFFSLVWLKGTFKVLCEPVGFLGLLSSPATICIPNWSHFSSLVVFPRE